MINRRDFVAMLAAASSTFTEAPALAKALSVPQDAVTTAEPANLAGSDKGGFPSGNYTPFGYLDNPWHTWDLHRSGILRSLPGIGFGLYYPAGPGGYFDFHDNGIYSAELALGFHIGTRTLRGPEDFRPGQLVSPYHTKNILTYAFEESGVRVACSYLQVDEDALAVRVEIAEISGHAQRISAVAFHTYRLGGHDWWGRDGLAGNFDERTRALWIRSFAAGTAFAIVSDKPSSAHFLSTEDPDCDTWLGPSPKRGEKLAYYPKPLHGGLRYELELAPHGRTQFTVVMARSANLPEAISHAGESLPKVSGVLTGKRAADATFWNAAPRLTGDWPEHWKRGWVYDFETLRTMVRRPIGVYKHHWDAMQIQAPRNVLAETSIDMWALSYVDPDAAKQVFLGQFLDALEPNVPCMREDGVMNMVAVDGSACGTSISWCFPFFCAESIFNRTRDDSWLRQLYPPLAKLMRWTLANRSDAGGFLVGKCSWETGMDTSKRFRIQQPTGGELVEFLRLVELQAAASQAGGILARFANAVGYPGDVQHWRQVQQDFAKKTQQLWKDDWFHDYDSRSGTLVTGTTRDPSQAAPAFCGIADEEQRQRMSPTLRGMYEELKAQGSKAVPQGDHSLDWSSFVLPFLEAAWSSGDGSLVCETVELIADRLYTSMDRRAIEGPVGPDGKPRRLGWPGVSCEIWGSSGAFGGEVYGWGAVMPAHIIRNLIGIRETFKPGRITLAPNFGNSLAVPNTQYGIAGFLYGKQHLDLAYKFLDEQRISVVLHWPEGVQSISQSNGERLHMEQRAGGCRFEVMNHQRYMVDLAN